MCAIMMSALIALQSSLLSYTHSKAIRQCVRPLPKRQFFSHQRSYAQLDGCGFEVWLTLMLDSEEGVDARK